MVDERYSSEAQQEEDNKFRKVMGEYVKQQYEQENKNRA
jgi:ABC-type transporter MlaC component